jgi:hypothetical protein
MALLLLVALVLLVGGFRFRFRFRLVSTPTGTGRPWVVSVRQEGWGGEVARRRYMQFTGGLRVALTSLIESGRY